MRVSSQWSVVSRSVFLLTLYAVLFVLCIPATAQQGRIARIGFLAAGYTSGPSSARDLFLKGLSELGYIEGKNILIDYRYAEGDASRFPELAAELVSLKVDVIVVASVQSALAASKATKTIPIVMAGSDPVGGGLVDSLSQPGGNITGIANPSAELGGKQLELLKESFPSFSRIAVLRNAASPVTKQQLKEIEGAGRSLGLQLSIVDAQGPKDFEKAFASMKKNNVQALNVLPSAIFTVNRNQLLEKVSKASLPTIYPHIDFVTAVIDDRSRSKNPISSSAPNSEPHRH